MTSHDLHVITMGTFPFEHILVSSLNAPLLQYTSNSKTRLNGIISDFIYLNRTWHVYRGLCVDREREWLVITLILMPLCLHRTVFYLCTVLCFALSLFLYACMHARFSYVNYTRIRRVYAAVHSYSCICLLRSFACSLGVIAYNLLNVNSLPSRSTGVMPRSRRSGSATFLVKLPSWRTLDWKKLTLGAYVILKGFETMCPAFLTHPKIHVASQVGRMSSHTTY